MKDAVAKRTRFVVAVVGIGFLALGPHDLFGREGRIQVDQDTEHFRTTVVIPSKNGRIQWADVVRGLSKARGFDETALKDLTLGGSFSVVGPLAELQLVPINLALSPSLRFRLQQDPERAGEANLVVVLDRKALLASERRFKSRLRSQLQNRMTPTRHFGVKWDKGWERKPPAMPLVVMVHGFQSHSEAVAGLIARPRTAGFPCGEFNYPNDQAISDSASLLARELRAAAEKQPDRSVILVTHSMGGLVSRAVIEDARLDPGNVCRLIMVGTPNQGTMLAHFAYGIDLWEYTLDAARRRSVRAFLGSVEDGLADALDDLRPGSLFLRDLNARPRNSNVQYTLLLGDAGLLTDDDLQRARNMIQTGTEQSRLIQFFGPKVDGWIKDLDEVVEGRGDGVVSVERGKLEGVDDTTVLHFRHLDFVGRIRTPGGIRAAEEVMVRIAATRSATESDEE